MIPLANHTLATAPARQFDLHTTPPSFAIVSNAHARNAYGSIAQDLACAALSLDLIPIDGRCSVCFDAQGPGGAFYEIKSVHRSGKLVIYDWRMEKEKAFPALYYLIVVHRARGCRSAAALLQALAQSLEFWLAPSALVHEAALACPLRCLLKPSTAPRNGYSRAGYIRGYRNVPLTLLRPLTSTPTTFTCYGQTWQAILCR